MALTVGDRGVRALTADEVLRMVETGILSEDEPVELLCGVLTEVSPKSPGHATVMSRLIQWLGAGASAGRYTLRTEHPLMVPDATSLPEPDIAIVEPGHDVASHPRTALLVVEVAVRSLRTDTTIKPALYAAAGVPELWVVDVPARRLRIFTDPGPDGYATEQAVGGDGLVRARQVDVVALDLAGLFAGL